MVALGLMLLLSGCPKPGPSAPGGGPPNFDAALFQECDSVCIRPGDCVRAYNDNGTCPPGFLCSLRFTCPTD